MGNVIAVLIVLVGIVSWIINIARQSEMQQKQKERRQRRGRSPMAIDEFIDDDEIQVVQPGRRGPQNQTRGRDEVWREQSGRERRPPQRQAPQRPAPQRQTSQRPTQNRQATQPAAKPAPRPQPERLADRHIQSNVGAHVERDLPHAINAAVANDLRTKSTGDSSTLETTGLRETPAGLLRKSLATPQGIRTAIMFSEILAPPLSRRRNS